MTNQEPQLLFFFDEDLPAKSRNVRFKYGPVEHLGPRVVGDTRQGTCPRPVSTLRPGAGMNLTRQGLPG
jgi:hypothetical protein